MGFGLFMVDNHILRKERARRGWGLILEILDDRKTTLPRTQALYILLSLSYELEETKMPPIFRGNALF